MNHPFHTWIQDSQSSVDSSFDPQNRIAFPSLWGSLPPVGNGSGNADNLLSHLWSSFNSPQAGQDPNGNLSSTIGDNIPLLGQQFQHSMSISSYQPFQSPTNSFFQSWDQQSNGETTQISHALPPFNQSFQQAFVPAPFGGGVFQAPSLAASSSLPSLVNSFHELSVSNLQLPPPPIPSFQSSFSMSDAFHPSSFSFPPSRSSSSQSRRRHHHHHHHRDSQACPSRRPLPFYSPALNKKKEKEASPPISPFMKAFLEANKQNLPEKLPIGLGNVGELQKFEDFLNSRLQFADMPDEYKIYRVQNLDYKDD